MPNPVPDRLSVEVGGVAVEARLRLDPRARRIVLKVDQSRRCAILTAPHRCHVGRAELLLRENAAWVREALAALPRRTRLADGAVLPVRGRATRIVHDPSRRRARLADDVLTVGGADDAVGAAALGHLKREARADLTEAAGRHAETLGVAFGRIRIGDPVRRWGSCSSSGTLSFSWRLVLAPPGVLDYVAAHEVAHIREMNHGPRFWALVGRLRPGWEGDSAWLKAHAAQLHAVGI